MNNFSEDIKLRFGIKELDSKTMIFRFNGFIDACNIDIANNMWHEKYSDSTNPYICKISEEKGHEYNINFSDGYETGKGRVLILVGRYNDLSVFLVNYCEKDYNKFKVNELPFRMKLKNHKENYNYLLEIECENLNSLCTFQITKTNDDYKNELNFYGTISFGDILKIVETFTKDPENLYNIYNNIIENKRFHFTKEELGKGIIDDEPVKKKKK